MRRSVYQQVNFGNVLSVFGHTNLASTVSIRDHLNLGSSIRVSGDAIFFGAGLKELSVAGW